MRLLNGGKTLWALEGRAWDTEACLLYTSTVFDCCGKPLAELGLVAEEERILRELDTRFRDSKIQEIVTLCPNCFHFLKGRLHVKVTRCV